MTSLHTDLDLTDAVEAAARHHWEQRARHIPWETAVVVRPDVTHDIREHVRPAVTAAAPVIAAAAIARARTALDELAHERNTWARQLADTRDALDTTRTERDQVQAARADVENRLTALTVAIEEVLADVIVDVRGVTLPDPAVRKLRRAAARAVQLGGSDE